MTVNHECAIPAKRSHEEPELEQDIVPWTILGPASLCYEVVWGQDQHSIVILRRSFNEILEVPPGETKNAL